MTGNTITVDGQELRLVRLTTNTYPVTPFGTDWSGEDLVFYAKDLDTSGDYVRLVVPTSDPRSAHGFYKGNEPAGHFGWNVERQYAVDIPEFAPGDRVRIVEVGSGLRPEWVGREVTYVGAPNEWVQTTHPHAVAFDADDEEATMLGMDDEGRRIGYVTRLEHVDTATVRTFTQEDVDRLVSEARTSGKREADESHQSWLDSLVSDLHDAANENNLCGEFDRFMLDHDLPAREREYEVTFDVRGRVTVTVTATNGDDAADFARDMEWDMSDVEINETDVYDVSQV